MSMPDDDLQRMVKNLKRAFNAAASYYEYKSREWGDSHKEAVEFAVISQAYLEASREQEKRERDSEKGLPGKTLKAPGTPKS